MAHCPNCGRETMRTKDWACQWCGYQLLSGFYHKIDKTYKEIQQERQNGADIKEETGVDVEEEKSSSREPEAVPDYRSEPVRESRREPEPVPRTELKPPIKPKSEPVSSPAPEPVHLQPEKKPEREPASIIDSTPPLLNVLPGAEAVTPGAPQTRPEPAPVARPEPVPEPVDVPPPSLESIVDGTNISTDQLDTLYRTDRGAIHSRLAGKTISVKGLVEKVVIRDHLDVRYLLLKGARKTNAWNVRCSFEREHNSEMGRLSEGQSVTVKGLYDGASKNILFKNCVLIG